MNRIASGTIALLSAALVGACGGGDGAGGSEPVGSTNLVHRSTDFHAPITTPGGPVPPVVEVDPPSPPSALPAPVACPAGTTCTFTPLSLAPPISTCTSPSWFTESGATASTKMVMACSYYDGGVSMLDTWVSQVNTSGYGAAIATSQVGLPDAAGGVVYVTYLPPTPTQFPDPSTGQPTTPWTVTSPPSWLVDPSGASLPCTNIYEYIPANARANSPNSAWAAYCVETPALEAWGNITALVTPAWAPYGFAYLGGSMGNIIGGSCAAGCTVNVPIVPGPIAPPKAQQ